MSNPRIGFIGLGNVGGKLAGSLLRHRIDLTVRDLNPDLVAEFVARGAKSAASPGSAMPAIRASKSSLPT